MSQIPDQLKQKVQERCNAYERLFKSIFAEDVLVDLAKFCRALETTFHPDPRVHAALEGRREVWLRIQKYANLSADDLLNLYKERADVRNDNTNDADN